MNWRQQQDEGLQPWQEQPKLDWPHVDDFSFATNRTIAKGSYVQQE
jgi:hypothetical protein